MGKKKEAAWKKRLGKTDRNEVRKAAKEEAARQKSGGGSNIVRPPDDMEFFEAPKKGRTRFALLPFIVPESGQKRFANRRKGTPWYALQYATHRNIGPEDDRIVCPVMTGMGNSCAVCNEYHSARKEYPNADQDTFDEHIKPFKTSMRDLFLIYDYEDNAVKLFDFSNFLFGKALAIEMGVAEEEDNVVIFLPEDGMDVQVTWAAGSFGGNDFAKASGVTFVPRKKELPDEAIEQALDIDLTECLVMLDGDAIYSKFHGVDDEEEGPEEEEPDAPDEEPDEEPDPEPEEEEDDEQECDDLLKAIKKLKDKDGTKKAKKLHGKGDVKGLTKLLAKLTPEPEEEEDDPAADGECPHGHEYGVDTDEKPECDDCESWDACYDAKEGDGD